MLSSVARRKNHTPFGFNPDVAFSYVGYFWGIVHPQWGLWDNLMPLIHWQLANGWLMKDDTTKDQRLQDVLGHFQKDFEREVSAENLGPNFGQYGSFLPMLLGNPLTQSQPKSLTSVQSNNIPKLLKKCNLQGCSNVTKKRKECSASVGDGNLTESATENNGVFSSAGSSTKLFGEMQGKSSVTKKRKECSASAGESDLNENPTENGGILSSAHSSTKLFGNLRHPNQLAENNLKEDIDLKHSADHLKNGDLEVEVSGIDFHATLKVLLAASMFEVCDMGSAAPGEKLQSTEIYINTAKILKQCAISFERNGEIAAAALAYKCMEVAYMRVIFSMSSHIRKDSLELQESLHCHPFGRESSPLSAIDVTNGHEDGAPPGSEMMVVKPLASRVTLSSPHLLNYAEYVSSAADATQRSLSALKAAQCKYGLHGIAAVKTALDFHFHDMDGFIRLVHLALKEIDIYKDTN